MNLTGLDWVDIMDKIQRVVEGTEKASDKDVRQMLTKMYKQMTGSFGPVIRGIPALTGSIAKDASPVVAALVELAASIGNSAEFKKAYGNLARAFAENRMIFFKAYKEAGFSAAQAFALVLQDAGKKMPFPPSPSFSSSSKSRSSKSRD